MRLLVIEDDAAVGRRMVRGLERAGFEVEWHTDGDRGLERAGDPSFELVVLDLMLPGLGGLEVLERLRGRATTPVVVVSARDGLESRLAAFDLGAVDFVAKPFWMEELVARIHRRLGQRPARVVRWDEVELDLDSRAVRVRGRDARLTPSELALLARLAASEGRAVSRADLAEASGGGATERTVDSHVARIRKKLEDGARAIHTVRGFGYRLVREEGA
ncbi:MAG TPA: response regulator transcription factor [Sandaracinaceae bacterium LLY-WYZ-13_1]|nr:response regulator transcription factor [Sandaracinaceae bacterium LLY-WYZ-13_1]